MMSRNCIFCLIVNNKIKAHKIYENKYAVALLDKHPINPGHLLVIPKKHIPDFYELEEKNFCELMKIVRKLSRTVSEKISPKKVGIVIAGFDIPHTHIHIIPMKKYHDITSKNLLEGKRANPDAKELEKMAKKLLSN